MGGALSSCPHHADNAGTFLENKYDLFNLKGKDPRICCHGGQGIAFPFGNSMIGSAFGANVEYVSTAAPSALDWVVTWGKDGYDFTKAIVAPDVAAAANITLPVGGPGSPAGTYFFKASSTEHESTTGDQTARGIIYCLVLGWMFLGVAIASDVFMSGIERITSSKTRIPNPADPTRKITVSVWNDTVANLTLMAFGSSTPEILLSIIEILTKDFQMGDLGASTIVGSAAFNLLIIIGICIPSIDSGEVRMIADITVYRLTAAFQLWAYAWLYIVLEIISPNMVDIWEAVLTFFMFIILVVVAYKFDQMGDGNAGGQAGGIIGFEGMTLEDLEEYSHALKQKFGKELPTEKVIALLEQDLAPKKSRMNYRSGAIRGLTGKASSTNLTNHSRKGSKDDTKRRSSYVAPQEDLEHGTHSKPASSSHSLRGAKKVPEVFWDVIHNQFCCLECVGKIQLPVKVIGPTHQTCKVRYETRDGTAKAGPEYTAASGMLEFEPAAGEQIKYIEVGIIDDEEQEDDMMFFVDLFPETLEGEEDISCEVFGPTVAVTIIDDDEPGELRFEHESIDVHSGQATIDVMVQRRKGGSGKISCVVYTENGTAKAGLDYEDMDETPVEFEHNELEKMITVKVINAQKLKQGREFRIVMGKPSGGAKLAEGMDGADGMLYCTAHFVTDGKKMAMLQSAKSTLNHNWEGAKIGSASYGAQFREAFWVNGSREDAKEASWMDVFLHVLCFPWKLMCACAPPPVYMNGWFTFYGALVVISIQTALISDIGEMIGCSFGIPDSITAITIVALGTSLPDTFASRTAAMNDDTADSSITNVTGSNSVNVFLGLGIPWMIGSFYWASANLEDARFAEWNKVITKKGPAGVQVIKDYATAGGSYCPAGSTCRGGLVHLAGSLGFSVIVYTICALVALAVLQVRRNTVGGEFGGPDKSKWGSCALFLLMWVIYIVASIIKSFEVDA